MKKLLASIIAACMLFSLCGCGNDAARTVSQETAAETEAKAVADEPSPTAERKTKAVPSSDIAILYTNDVHCGIEDGIGYSGLAAIKNAMQAAGKTVLLVDGGDFTQGASVGTVSKGEYLIDIMNELGYDVAAIGNHEFDYGMEQFFKNRDDADFPFVSCNFVDKDGNTVLNPYIIKEVNGVNIAFLGITTPLTPSSSTPSYFQDENGQWIYTFCQDDSGELLLECVQSAVDAARQEGADYVIALTHLGIEAACEPWTSGDVINGTSGIDAFLDAHSHSVIEGEKVKNANGKEVTLTSTGTKLANIACLNIDTDGSISVSLINDGGTQEYIDGIKDQYEDVLNAVLAHSDVELYITDPATGMRMIRSNETNLGDLFADAYRSVSGSDIALINGGCIRKDISAGDITYGNILDTHPFGNMLTMVEATGQQIIDALELSVSFLPGEFGGFMQVSGISFTVDMSVESSVETDSDGMFVGVTGERRIKDVLVSGEPIDLEKTYTVASVNYVLKENGDGYNMFVDCDVLLDKIMLDNQVVCNYISDALGGIIGSEYSDPYGDSRINIING